MALLARHRLVLTLLALGLALRVVLAFAVFPHAGYAGDLDQFWQWARALAEGGSSSFYAPLACLLGLFGRLGNEFSMLSANAFKPWALVGDPSLATVVGAGSGTWLPDSMPALGSNVVIVASATGLVLALAALLAAWLVVVARPEWIALARPRLAATIS